MLSIRELEPGAISVFKVDLDDVHLSTRRDLLAPDELARADRFRLHVQKDTAHQVRPEAVEVAIAWFEKWLAPPAK